MEQRQSNGLGLAGFILSLCSIVFCWVPILNWILVILALVFSIIGIFKQPKGLAIAGLIISGIWVLLFLIVFGAIIGAATL